MKKALTKIILYRRFYLIVVINPRVWGVKNNQEICMIDIEYIEKIKENEEFKYEIYCYFYSYVHRCHFHIFNIPAPIFNAGRRI